MKIKRIYNLVKQEAETATQETFDSCIPMLDYTDNKNLSDDLFWWFYEGWRELVSPNEETLLGEMAVDIRSEIDFISYLKEEYET